METLVLENKHKIIVPIFGVAAYAAPNKGITILYWFRSLSTVLSPTEIVEFKLLSDLPVLFKADLIFKDFSRKTSKFKYFSSLCQPCDLLFVVVPIVSVFLCCSLFSDEVLIVFSKSVIILLRKRELVALLSLYS